jgi:hypothetical protein
MQAMAEVSEREWAENNIDAPQFRHFANRQGGRLLGQGWHPKGKLLELCYSLHVDDGAFLFMNRKDTVMASRLTHRTMARFGLMIMHILGLNGKNIKLKPCVTHRPTKSAENKKRKLVRCRKRRHSLQQMGASSPSPASSSTRRH